MTDATLFSDSDDNLELDTSKNYLEELVGDGKKFATVEDLARGKAEADRFIDQLKTEMAGLRDDLKTRMSVEAALNKLSTEAANTPASPKADDGVNNETAKMSPEDIEAFVAKKIKETREVDAQRANLAMVTTKLREVFGSNHVQHLRTVASELGLSEEALESMAKTSPQAFLRLVGADGSKPRIHAAPPASGVNSGSFTPSGGTDRNLAYYEALRKSNPTEYWSPRVQNEMHKNALALGEKFFTK